MAFLFPLVEINWRRIATGNCGILESRIEKGL